MAEEHVGRTEDAREGSAKSEDDELDALLDSALKDFDKVKVVPAQLDGSCVDCQTNVKADDEKCSASNNSLQEEALFHEIFQAESSTDEMSQIESAMNNLMKGDPEMLKQFDRLVKGVGLTDGTESLQSLPETLAHTLGSLAQNTEQLQEHVSEDNLLQAMSDMGGMVGQEGEEDFLPVMHNMMQSLLSKEVLYPSLKDISAKYPDWLEKNKSKLSEVEFEKYKRQHNLMEDICLKFEEEQESDSSEAKQARFERILSLMQKMQDCGQPPSDIVGDMDTGLEFDDEGNPRLPGMPGQGQCVIS